MLVTGVEAASPLYTTFSYTLNSFSVVSGRSDLNLKIGRYEVG